MYENLKSQILHLLQKDATPRSRTLLSQALGLSAEWRNELDVALNELSAAGQLVLGPGNQVRLPCFSQEVIGTFHTHARGFGFVTPQQATAEGEVFIPAKAVGNAMTGDRVLAQIVRKKSSRDPDRISGKIVKVLERAHSSIVGTLRCQAGTWAVYPDGTDLQRPIQCEEVDTREVEDGDKVSLDIRVYPSRNQPARGVITQILGQTGCYNGEIAGIIRRYGLYDGFDDSSLVEANNSRSNFHPEQNRDRADLTRHLIVTIDPPDAQDFDDAISLKRNRRGEWILGVHIADVSYFVRPGSALDQAARLRGNSVYLPGKTLPMLPEMLSNDICSLQPNQPRYTKTVYLTYGKDGTLRRTRFLNSLIQSKARLTYQEVDQILKDKKQDLPQRFITLLRNMEKLARLIEKRRRHAGMLQLQMPERDIRLDHSGRVQALEPVDTSYPHTIIEMFMVEANIAVATLLDRYCIPFMRRIHPKPNTATQRQLSQTLRLLGVTLPRRTQRRDLQRIIRQFQGAPLELPVNLLVLRSLAKASYSPANVGHYALAAGKYCHFTSPIRRYADLLVHRVLGDYLEGRVERARRSYSFADLSEIGLHISETEQDAEEATHEVKTIFILHLLRKHIGETIRGVVVNLNAYGVSVHLSDFGVEGLLRPENLGPDTWQYKEHHQCLIGRHTRNILRLAQPIQVRIAEVNPSAGHLDLVPAQALGIQKTKIEANKTPRRNNSRQQARDKRKVPSCKTKRRRR
jgi:ribonuclease R